MPSITVNGVHLEYLSQGNPAHETILLIMGLGTQLTGWPEELCEGLVSLGYHVLRFDNRDIGLSMRFDHARVPNIPGLVLRKSLRIPARVPYHLEDMAADAIGLLDALGIARAHMVGASMGGMIAQLIAAHYPERTLSLTSIMSTTGHRSLPRADRNATRALMQQPEDPSCMDSVVARNVRVRKALQSRSHPKTDEEIRETAAAAVARGGHYPEGVARQLSAIIVAPERRALLRGVQSPALVIHGDEDPLVKVACGVDTARHLPNGELMIMAGMGHDFPRHLLGDIARGIHATARRV